jgi:hypothetical protein
MDRGASDGMANEQNANEQNASDPAAPEPADLDRAGLDRLGPFDLQGWLTVAAGLLLALITLFTSYDHVDIPGSGTIPLDQQVGVLLLLALVPALVGDAQLATRSRLRAQRDRVQEQRDRVRAENEAAADRREATQRARRQARCDRIAFEYQLDPSPDHARQLRTVIALLTEYGELM